MVPPADDDLHLTFLDKRSPRGSPVVKFSSVTETLLKRAHAKGRIAVIHPGSQLAAFVKPHFIDYTMLVPKEHIVAKRFVVQVIILDPPAEILSISLKSDQIVPRCNGIAPVSASCISSGPR